MQNYGKRIKEARVKIGLTQSEAAEKMGVTQQAWQRFEGGKYDLKMSTVKGICQTLEVSADWLIGVDEAALAVKGIAKPKIGVKITEGVPKGRTVK